MKRFILSDGTSVNSRGYRVDIAGGQLERFKKNPVMLYEHDARQVLGYWKDIEVVDGKLSAEPVFDGKDAFAAEIGRKVEEGFLRGASIGFIPQRMTQKNGEPVMSRWELVEASIVSIPSDSDAVRLYNSELEVITFEQVKLNFNIQKKSNMEMEGLSLSQRTVESLSLSGTITPERIETAVLAKDGKIEDLEKRISDMQKLRCREYLDAAVKDGKIQAAERESFEKLSVSDFDAVKAIIDAKPAQASASLAGMARRTTLAAERQGWDYIKWMKEDPSGLQQLKHDNPAAFEQLQATIPRTKN